MSRRSFFRRLGYLFALFCLAGPLLRSAEAGPANPTPFPIMQPDGVTFVARMVGDEHWNAHETIEGFTILRNSATSFWVYAGRDGAGTLVPTALVVGRDQPAGLPL